MSVEQNITDEAAERFPSLRGVQRRERRRVLIRLIAWTHDEIDAGRTDEEEIVDAVLKRARSDEFGISPILIIILGELVAWIVRRILDRIFPKEGASGGNA